MAFISCPDYRKSLNSLLFCFIFVQASPSFSNQTAILLPDPQTVTEGYITLSWNELGENQPVVLQVATDAGLQKVIRSLHLQGQAKVHLSGFGDGVYYARLAAPDGQWLSAPARFEVQHRDLGLASLLFAIGAGLFCFLLATLFRFNRTSH